MYILENTMLKNTLITLSLSASMLLLSGCTGEEKKVEVKNTTEITRAVDGGVLYPTTNGKYTAYNVNTQNIDTTSFGRTPTKTELAAWNIDVMPDGTGLPEFDTKHGKVIMENGQPKKAQGNAGYGNELYDTQCAMCHGDFGAGGKGYPTLSGGDIESLTNQLLNPADDEPSAEPPVRRIGSYWPYASTLFWYIQDAMPFPHPKSLSNSETYAITAYLLMENEVTVAGQEIDEDFVLSKENFASIEMPNKDGFYPNVDTPNDPAQGVRNVTKYLSDNKNYGAGTRCMTNCIDGKVPVLHIGNELGGITPEPSTVRDLPPEENAGPVHPGKKPYEASCSVCHATDAMGAPAVGNAEAWSATLEKGVEKVYHNAINGINGMPPRGGTSFDDAKMKEIIDYMMESSK